MCIIYRTFCLLTLLHYTLLIKCQDDYAPDFVSNEQNKFENGDSQITNSPYSDKSDISSVTEYPGGTVTNRMVFEKSRSPYWLRNDVIVERNAELVVEPGVTVKVDPQVGITVRGILNAQVSWFHIM